jgi:hypothetical protein
MMQIIHYRIIVQFQQIALEEKRHMGQATGIVGKGALAFAGNNYRSVELFVMNRKIRSIFTCPFNDGYAFFS